MANPQYYTGDEDDSDLPSHEGGEPSHEPQRGLYTGPLGSGPLGPVNDSWVERASQHSGQIYSRPLGQLPPSQVPPQPPQRAPQSDIIGPIRAQAHQRLTGAGVPLTPSTAPSAPSQPTDADSQPDATAEWRSAYGPMPLDEDLERRRQYDRARTGRDWPCAIPRSDTERLLMQQLCFAPGHVDAKLLARVNARRFARAATSPSPTVYGGDKCGKTDIYSIAYFGLNLDLDTRPFSADPLQAHTLATYASHRPYDDPQIQIDDVLVTAPPTPEAYRGEAGWYGEPYAWRDAIDATWTARFLVAWCCAQHLTQIATAPLTIGFVPKLPEQGFKDRDVASELNRYTLAMIACAELLAPRERLERQIAFLLRQGAAHYGVLLNQEQIASCTSDRWGAAIAHYGPWLFREEVERCRREGVAFDAVAYFLWLLARMNACPQLLVQRSLDEHRGPATPRFWSERLLYELEPELCPREPHQRNRFRQALATYETLYGYRKWFGRQPLTLTLAL